jgi:hypothetical protein
MSIRIDVLPDGQIKAKKQGKRRALQKSAWIGI